MSLSEKVQAAQKLLSKHQCVVPSSGAMIKDDTRKELLYLINMLRETQSKAGKMHGSNLCNWLNHPEDAPRRFLGELTAAMGLADLGFDESLWEMDRTTILESIEAALTGGVIATVLSQPLNQVLFKLAPCTSMGINFQDYVPRQASHPIHEFTVKSGDVIATEATIDRRAFLRVVACEEDHYIGLNAFLNIPASSISPGTYRFGTFNVTERVPRTLIYAFASSEPCFHDWPVSHQKGKHLSYGGFFVLLRQFYAGHAAYRASNVQSFVTMASSGVGTQQ